MNNGIGVCSPEGRFRPVRKATDPPKIGRDRARMRPDPIQRTGYREYHTARSLASSGGLSSRRYPVAAIAPVPIRAAARTANSSRKSVPLREKERRTT